MTTQSKTASMTIGPLQIGIIITALITAVCHLILISSLTQSPPDPMFILNGLGYLALLIVYFLPLPIARQYHGLIRWVFIAFTAITILGWVVIGLRIPLGYLTKLDELVLIVLLWLDKPR